MSKWQQQVPGRYIVKLSPEIQAYTQQTRKSRTSIRSSAQGAQDAPVNILQSFRPSLRGRAFRRDHNIEPFHQAKPTKKVATVTLFACISARTRVGPRAAAGTRSHPHCSSLLLKLAVFSDPTSRVALRKECASATSRSTLLSTALIYVYLPAQPRCFCN